MVSSAVALPQVTDPIGFVDTLESAGLVESEPGTDEPTRRYPVAVEESLLRSAAIECPDELQAARVTLVRYSLDRGDARCPGRFLAPLGDASIDGFLPRWSTAIPQSQRSAGCTANVLLP